MGIRINPSLYKTIKRVTHSSNGHNIMLYLMFVCVAFVLWVFLSLDNDVQRDFDVPVQFDNIPDSVVVINKLPASINAVVQGKGSQFVRYMWGKMPAMKINFNDLASVDKKNIRITRSKLESMMRDYFGQGMLISNMRPDSILIVYTTEPGHHMKLHVNADVKASLQSIISGPITADVDSVMVYSQNDIPRFVKYIETEPLIKSELTDTSVYEVHVKPVAGMRIVPDVVTVTVPVEPLISKRRTVALEKINLPNGVDIITFPSAIEVSYLVPMSKFNSDYPIKTFVDFTDIQTSSDKIKVNLSAIPEVYHNVAFKPDSVEFYIENRLHKE